MKLQSGLRILHPCICLFFFTFQLLCVGYILQSYHFMILADFLAVYQCDWYRGQSYHLFNARTCWLCHHIFPTVHSYEVDIIHAFIHSFIWLVLGPAGDFYLLKSVPLKMLHAKHSIPVTVQWFVFNMFLQTFVTLAQIPELNWRWNLLKIEFLICNVYSL